MENTARKLITSAVAILGISCATLFAQNTTPTEPPTKPPASPNPIGRVAENQRDRIQRGLKSGELTPKQATRLSKMESNLNKKVANAREKNGGTLTSAERAQVRRDEKRLSRDIRRAEHGNRRSPGR